MVASVSASPFYDAVMGWAEAGLTVRVVRGDKMTTFEKMMDEFAAALQFPYYFGENWGAFQECIEDMEWLPRGEGIDIAVSKAPAVLSEEPVADLETLVRRLADASSTYSSPVDLGKWWDRPAVPFHVVLQQDDDERGNLERWRTAGATLVPIEVKQYPS